MASKKKLSAAERKTLEEERTQTNAELERLRQYLKEEPEATGDEVDLQVYEREKQLALLHHLELKLKEIQRALETAKNGRYGICERCSKPIDLERLKALPEATMCVKCKNELEAEARRAHM